jgi:hypothetical protein
MNKINLGNTPPRNRPAQPKAKATISSPRTPVRATFPVRNNLHLVQQSQAELPSGSGDMPVRREATEFSPQTPRNRVSQVMPDIQPPRLQTAYERRKFSEEMLPVRVSNKIKNKILKKLSEKLSKEKSDTSVTRTVIQKALQNSGNQKELLEDISKFGYGKKIYTRVENAIAMASYLNLKDFHTFPNECMEKRIMSRIDHKVEQILTNIQSRNIIQSGNSFDDIRIINDVTNDFINSNGWLDGTINMAMSAASIPVDRPVYPIPFLGQEDG